MEYLEIGKIVNTHGVAGDVKVEPWADSPSFFLGFNRFFLRGTEVKAQNVRVHKNHVLIKFEGVDSIDEAMKLRNETVCIFREDAKLPEGRFFISDIIGFDVFDIRLNRVVGTLAAVTPSPAGDLYVVRDERCREFMIPGNPVFLKEINPDARRVTVSTIVGMDYEN